MSKKTTYFSSIFSHSVSGTYTVTQLTAEDGAPIPVAGHVDVFGLPVVTHTGLPTLKVVIMIKPKSKY